MADDTKATYESPNVTDFGTIENVTQGATRVSITDLPTGVGSPNATPDPTSGPL